MKRQAAPDQQLNVGRPRHTRTQPTRPGCPVASRPNGRRLLRGACEPSRSMFPLRARATRARGVPPPFRASKGSALARSRSRSRRNSKGPKRDRLSGELSSVARRAAAKDATPRQHRARAVRLRRTNYGTGARLRPSTTPHSLGLSLVNVSNGQVSGIMPARV